MTNKTKAERTCSEIATARARHGRTRAAASGASPLRGEILFGVTWLSSLISSLLTAPLRARHPASSPEPTYRPTPQELGVPGPLLRSSRGRLHGRYRISPSMSVIMRDLKRPVARDAARAALMAQLGSDPATREWAAAQIDSDDMWRLALHVRSGRSDVDVVAAWRAEAAAERAASEAEVAAALRARIGAADAVAQDGGEGGDEASTAPRIR